MSGRKYNLKLRELICMACGRNFLGYWRYTCSEACRQALYRRKREAA